MSIIYQCNVGRNPWGRNIHPADNTLYWLLKSTTKRRRTPHVFILTKYVWWGSIFHIIWYYCLCLDQFKWGLRSQKLKLKKYYNRQKNIRKVNTRSISIFWSSADKISKLDPKMKILLVFTFLIKPLGKKI